MTLMTGLRHPERLAGLVGISGYLPSRRKPPPSAAANGDVPIFLAHGTGDPVIPIARGARSRAMRCSRSATRSSGTSTRCRIRCAPQRSPT